MTDLPVIAANPCWQAVGVWGDRTCPELKQHTHCHNCPVFAAAGRRFLDAPSPAGYLDEWTARLAEPVRRTADGVFGALVFRLGEEWLALPVGVLVEVTHPRWPHRIPHRGGLLAGLVNVRGELHLCVRLDLLLGIERPAEPAKSTARPRMVVMRRDTDRWAFAADDVDLVRRVATADLVTAPPTLARAAARVTRGVVHRDGRAIGLLDETRLFEALRERVR
ncbi:chemotaxis protein CheW [Urbifossiella limnaea]|uniref:Chemotaxis protein CheW n=1 Tax=Urbifossiella limnaea TaxID=2528023 RepID=A0A517XYX2_9BACT|nr:chemotaxis protein CheW [Urbifossiella limnaea]QDU22691.1 CheW-like domain protein [Urbifossiella limnaea]